MKHVGNWMLIAWLAAVTGGVGATGLGDYYVSPVQPALPPPEDARRMTDRTRVLLAPLGRFHREAARRAWTGSFVDRTAPAAQAGAVPASSGKRPAADGT